MGMPAALQGRATYRQPGEGWGGEEHPHPRFLRALDLGLVPRCPRGRGCHGATEQGRQGLPHLPDTTARKMLEAERPTVYADGPGPVCKS